MHSASLCETSALASSYSGKMHRRNRFHDGSCLSNINIFHIILQSNYKYFLQVFLKRSSNIVTLRPQPTQPSWTCSSSSTLFIIISRPKASRPVFERCKCFINERIASSLPCQTLLYLWIWPKRSRVSEALFSVHSTASTYLSTECLCSRGSWFEWAPEKRKRRGYSSSLEGASGKPPETWPFSAIVPGSSEEENSLLCLK